MTIKTAPKPAPINTLSFTSALSGSMAWMITSAGSGGWYQSVAAVILTAVAAISGARALAAMWKDWRLRVQLAAASRPSSDHGTARQATSQELIAAGMENPSNGALLGIAQGGLPVWMPPRAPFMLMEAPPGSSKTIASVIGNILHNAALGRTVWVPDVKLELATMLAASLRSNGIDVWCINPSKGFLSLCGNTEINLYQPIIDAFQSADEFRKDTIKLVQDIARIHLPEPAGDEKNIYFRNGSRRAICAAVFYLLISGKACTPTAVFSLLNDPAALERALLYLKFDANKDFPSDPIVEFARTEAASLLDRQDNNSENFGAFLEGATQTLVSFSRGGRLEDYGANATASIATLRERQVVVFVMTPLSHARELEPFVSLSNFALLEACKRMPSGRPIHIVGDELLNYRMGTNLPADMETMRGLGLSADFYIQSFAGLTRKFGREGALAIESYADVKIYAGVNSIERAEHVSKMLAKASVRGESYSYDVAASKIGVSVNESGRPLMTPDEVLSMPRNQAWMFARGLRPVLMTLAHYGEVAPWRDQVGHNPLEGPPLRAAPRFGITYSQDADAKGRRRARLGGVRPTPRVRGVGPAVLAGIFRPSQWIWLPCVLALWAAASVLGAPYFRVSYEAQAGPSGIAYERCTYLGVSTFELRPPDGHCPLLLFR